MKKVAPPHQVQAGFTLMEVVLVLAIIVAVGAIAVPMYHGTLKQERLRKGAELIAADWTRTRATAMETGESQVWLCQLASNSYAASAYNSSMSSADAASMVTATTGLTATGASSSTDSFGQTLPYGVTIGEVIASEADSFVTMSEVNTSGSSGTATLFFYPDGTSSSARLTVLGEDQRTMSIVMNGLAGTVRVMRQEQSAP